MTKDKESCPLRCPACPLPAMQSEAGEDAGAADPGKPTGLTGAGLVLAAGYIFGVPLATIIAAEVALGGRLGELAALGVGLAGSAVLLVPAWWLMRPARRAGPDDVLASAGRGQEVSE